MCLPKILFPVFIFAFIFSLPLIFIWPLAFLIFLPPLWNFYVFLPMKFVSFVFTRFSSKKKMSEKTRLCCCCCCFPLKVQAAMRFSSVAFGLPYLLMRFFYIGVPVVRTDVRWRLSCFALPPPPSSPLHPNVDAPPPSNGPRRQITGW